MDKNTKRVLLDIAESLAVFILIFVMSVTNILSTFDYILKDKLYQVPRGITSTIKIIKIDEETLEEYGPYENWKRDKYAELIEILNSNEDYKPSVIAFDILFSGEKDEESDEAFAKAAEESGNVVVAFNYKYSEKPEKNAEGLMVHPVEAAYYPYEALKNVTRMGFSNISQDSDQTVRRIKYDEEYEGQQFKSLSKVIFDTYSEITGCEKPEIPTDKYGRTLINYSSKPGEYEAVSLVDVLNGKIDSRAFKDSIVIVGAYANGMQDSFYVPNGGSKQMYGVEIHANIVQSFMQARFSVNGNPYLYGAIFAFLGMVLHFLYKRIKIYFAAPLMVVGIGAQIAAGIVLNNNGICINLIYLPLITIISFIYSLSIKYIVELVKKRQIINAFKKYVAPQVVDEISKSGEFKVNLGGEERDISVLFVDIRGFTTMSEALPPTEIVKILNEYLALTTKSIFDNMGTLDKFVGDATMAVFNSPFPLEDYEYKSVCAAMAIADGGRELAPVFEEKYGRSVGFGVGVNCGKAVIGNVGCDFRMDFTAIGDTVNTAARLEANAKAGQVLISEDLYERLKGRIEVTEVGPISLKGKSNTFKIYQVDKLLG